MTTTTKFLKALLFTSVLFICNNLFSHSVQVVYCVSCDGELKLWVEHWHGNQNPNSTTMTITTTINGVTTNQTASPSGAVMNTTLNNLPGCATQATTFATGTGPNTELDWVSYDFPGVQPGDVVNITVVSGNNAFTQSSGGMYPASTGNFTIPAPATPLTPIADMSVCSGDVIPVQQFTSGNITWDNSNPNIGLGATGNTEVPQFTTAPVNTTQTGTITISNGCFQEQYNITVNADPAPAISIAPQSNPNYGGSTQCAYDDILFSSAGTVPAANQIASYEWDFGDGNTSTDPNPSNFYNSPGTYNVELEVTSINGCISTHTETFVIYPTPLASFSVNDECVYDAANFINQSTVDNPSNVTGYTWDFGDGNTSTDMNPSNLYANHGTYNISLGVVTESGCLHDTALSVEIFPKPVADFTFGNACFNAPLDFVSTSTVVNGTINQNLWDVQSDNVVDYTGPNGQHYYPAAGLYDLTHYAISDFGCSDTITQEITVYSLPDAQWTVTSVCEDASSTFTDNSTVVPFDNDQIVSWEWDFGDGATSVAQNPVHSYGAENVYDARLVVTTNFGCTDTLEQPATVWPLPEVDFSPTDVCLEFATQFQDQSTISNNYTVNNNVQWEWDFDDGTVANVQNPSHTYLNDGTYYTNLTVTSDNGCINDTTLPVTVHPKPVADFTFINSCFNTPLEFESTSTVLNGNIADNLWDVQSDNSVDYNGSTGNHYYPQAGLYDITHYAVTDYGCRDTVTKGIIVYALPDAQWSVNPVCEDTLTTFVDNSTIVQYDNDQIVTWEWDFGDGVTSTNQNPIHGYGSENIYDVSLIVTTNFNCKDTLEQTATVWPLPEVDFSPNEVCLEFYTQFEDESTISNDYTTNNNVQWEWDFGDGNTANVQNPSYAYQSDGIFNANLTVTSNNGCVNDSTLPVTVHPKPEASFEGVELSGCSPICPEVTSTSIVNQPSNINYYEWRLSDGRVYEGSTPMFGDCYENLTGNSIFYGVELIVTTDEGCKDTLNKANYIEVYHNPIADFYFEPEKPDIVNSRVEFTNTSLYADSYNWDIDKMGNYSDVHPIIDFPFVPDSYPVEMIASTDEGCTDTAWTVVEVADRIIFYVPNTFTPDVDNFNETFQPVFASGYDPFDFTLLIFNRWGELVFESHDASKGWNGTYGLASEGVVRDGTYLWKIEFKESMSDKRHTHVGHVNVLR